jgi:hypothetical protein
MDVAKVSNTAANNAYHSAPQAVVKAESVSQQQNKQPAKESVSVDKINPVSPTVDSLQINSSSVTLKNLAFVRDIEQMHVNMNRLAKGIRETNEALVKVAEQARQMQGETYAIIKNFPPFTRESQERQQILMSYISIEKEILKMTVPPPVPPVYDRIKHLWDTTFNTNGQLLPSALPSLQTTSSDQEVKSAASALEQLGKNFDNISSASTEALIGR